MPYRKLTLTDGTVTPIRRVDWHAIALCVTPNILADCRSALNGSDKGKFTVYSTTLASGNKLYVSNGREVLE